VARTPIWPLIRYLELAEILFHGARASLRGLDPRIALHDTRVTGSIGDMERSLPFDPRPLSDCVNAPSRRLGNGGAITSRGDPTDAAAVLSAGSARAGCGTRPSSMCALSVIVDPRTAASPCCGLHVMTPNFVTVRAVHSRADRLRRHPVLGSPIRVTGLAGAPSSCRMKQSRARRHCGGGTGVKKCAPLSVCDLLEA